MVENVEIDAIHTGDCRVCCIGSVVVAAQELLHLVSLTLASLSTEARDPLKVGAEKLRVALTRLEAVQGES